MHDPLTGEPYSRDPRNVARKAEDYLASTGIADTAFFGPEAEFYVFDYVASRPRANDASTTSTPMRAPGTPARDEDAATSATRSGTRAATSRSRRSTTSPTCAPRWSPNLIASGLRASSAATTRSAPPARPRSTTSSTPCSHAADDLMLFKYIIKNTAWAARQDRHLHAQAALRRQRLRHALPPVALEGRRAALLRRVRLRAACPTLARYYIGGLLKHAPSLLAFTNPTVNSYHRLVPGYEAPVNLVYSQRNRSACIRIPITGSNPKAKRIEFRVPGPVGQPVPRVLRAC